MQIRRSLDAIQRDEPLEGQAVTATTYSWTCELWKPGVEVAGEPILRVRVERAGPFDPAWVKAREALAQKQKEWEPSRQTVTQDDISEAIRRARVR